MVEVLRVDAPVPDGLLPWAVGTFHAAAVLLVLAGVVLVGTRVFHPLAGLGTGAGALAVVLLGGYTWGVVWWTTGRWLGSTDPDPFGPAAPQNAVVASAVLWGGATGLLVFVPSFGLGLLLVAGSGADGTFAFLVLSAAIGAAVGAAAGAVLWGILALVDLFLLRLARAWLPAPD